MLEYFIIPGCHLLPWTKRSPEPFSHRIGKGSGKPFFFLFLADMFSQTNLAAQMTYYPTPAVPNSRQKHTVHNNPFDGAGDWVLEISEWKGVKWTWNSISTGSGSVSVNSAGNHLTLLVEGMQGVSQPSLNLYDRSLTFSVGLIG